MEKRVKGNYIAFAVPIVLRNISAENGVTEQRYVPTNEDKIIVRLIGYKIHTYVPTLSLGGEVVFADNGTLGEGVYGLEVLIEQADGRKLRSYVADVLNIVNETKDADTETENEEAVEIESTLLAYTDGNGSSTIISGLTEQEVRALVTTMLQDYARLTDIPAIPSIPEPYDDTNILNALANKVDKVAGKGLSTNDFTDSLKHTLESLANNAITSNDLAQAVSNAISALDDVYQPKGNYLTEHQSLEAYALKSELANYVLASALAAVATSGSYNDLLDKPTIPSAYDDTAIKNRLNALEQSGGDGSSGTATSLRAVYNNTNLQNGYYNLSGGVGSTAPVGVTDYQGTYSMRIAVKGGDMYSLTTNGSSSARAYALTDKSLIMYEVANANAVLRTQTITILSDGWLYINCTSSGYADFLVTGNKSANDIINTVNQIGDSGISFPQYRNNPLPIGKTTLKIVCFGNSFVDDSTAELDNILSGSNVDASKICVYLCNVGGSQFSTFTDADKNGTQLTISRRCGTMSMTTKVGTLKQILRQDWDIVVINNYSRYATDFSTFGAVPLFTRLIREYCPNQKVCIAYQNPWGHTIADTESVLNGTEYTAKRLATEMGIDIIIPCGIAIQNARGTSLNNAGYLTRDNWHLAFGVARYVAACTFWQTIIAPVFNDCVVGNTATRTLTSEEEGQQGAEAVTINNREICQRCAFYAYIDNFHVSTIDEESIVVPEEPSEPVELSGLSINLSDTISEATQADVSYSPNNVDNSYKGVTWSIESGSEYATINSNGVITPIASGSVTIKATSTHNSSIYATKIITISVGSQSGGNEEPVSGEIALSSLEATWINTNWGNNQSSINTSTAIPAETCLATFPKIRAINDCILVAREGYKVQALSSDTADNYSGKWQTGWVAEIDLSALADSTYQCLGVHSADNYTPLTISNIDNYAYLRRKD